MKKKCLVFVCVLIGVLSISIVSAFSVCDLFPFFCKDKSVTGMAALDEPCPSEGAHECDGDTQLYCPADLEWQFSQYCSTSDRTCEGGYCRAICGDGICGMYEDYDDCDGESPIDCPIGSEDGYCSNDFDDDEDGSTDCDDSDCASDSDCISCTDTDGGGGPGSAIQSHIVVKGTCTDSTGSYTDYCNEGSSAEISEYYCDDGDCEVTAYTYTDYGFGSCSNGVASGSIVSQTCSEQGGYLVLSGQSCGGNTLEASDGDCCSSIPLCEVGALIPYGNTCDCRWGSGSGGVTWSTVAVPIYCCDSGTLGTPCPTSYVCSINTPLYSQCDCEGTLDCGSGGWNTYSYYCCDTNSDGVGDVCQSSDCSSSQQEEQNQSTTTTTNQTTTTTTQTNTTTPTDQATPELYSLPPATNQTSTTPAGEPAYEPTQAEVTEAIILENGTASCSQGCLYGGACFPVGIRKKIEDMNVFCNTNSSNGGFVYVWDVQRAENLVCDNHYECRSNFCVDDRCVKQGLITRIINWFKNLFNIITPSEDSGEANETIPINQTNMTNQTS